MNAVSTPLLDSVAASLPGDGGIVQRLLAFIDAGGPVVVILFACSGVALAIILMKLWQFHTARLGDRRVASQAVGLLRRGRADEASAELPPPRPLAAKKDRIGKSLSSFTL